MATTEMTLSHIRERGHAALLRVLGPTGYVRFLQQFERGEGDYTRERDQWLQGVTIDDVAAELDRPAKSVAGSSAPSGKAVVDLRVLYGILRDVAARGRAGHTTRVTLSYGDLSADYERRTGVALPAHGTWDQPLSEINQRAFNASPQLPPLSAVVTAKPEDGQLVGLPGTGFWGSAGVPGKPRDPVLEWSAILKKVYTADWPPELP